MVENFRLILFDFDDTLVQHGTTNILPQAREAVAVLGTLHPRPSVGIVANLPGPALREYARATGDKLAVDRYPAVEEEERRVQNVTGRLEIPQHAVYVCFALQLPDRQWVDTPHRHAGDPRWARVWRKPRPDMVIAAMSRFAVRPEQTLLIGRAAVNQATAARAGCAYLAELPSPIQKG